MSRADNQHGKSTKWLRSRRLRTDTVIEGVFGDLMERVWSTYWWTIGKATGIDEMRHSVVCFRRYDLNGWLEFGLTVWRDFRVNNAFSINFFPHEDILIYTRFSESFSAVAIAPPLSPVLLPPFLNTTIRTIQNDFSKNSARAVNLVCFQRKRIVFFRQTPDGVFW